MRGPVCSSRWGLDSSLWGHKDPRFPDAYAGGSVSVRVDVFRVVVHLAQTRSRWSWGRADRVFNYDGNTHELRAFGFTFGKWNHYRRHCAHLSIGPVTVSVVDVRVLGDRPVWPLWPVVRNHARRLLAGWR